MAVALESNPAGTFHLIESGCYGFTGTRANGYQFDDPTLADWTDRFSDGSVSVAGGVLSVGASLLLMWNSPSVSPQHTLPNNQIITTLRGRWNFNTVVESGDYHTNAVGIMSTSILPWQSGGFAMGSGGKIFFGEMWHTWAYENGVFQSYHTGMVASPASSDHWSACRVKPDGTGGCDCSAGGLNLIQGAHGFQPDAPFTWCVCDAGNYALTGNPGLVSWQFGSGAGDGTEYFEWHAFYDTTIKIIGMPAGWKGRVIKVGDAVRAADTNTQTESGGEAILGVALRGDSDMPPWDEVQVLNGADVVQDSIQVRTFQPGTYGGDVYSFGAIAVPPPPCPTIEVGISVTPPDCDSGVSVTFPDCDAGVSVTFPLGDIGILLCPTGTSHTAIAVVAGKAGSSAIAALGGIQQDGSGFLYEDAFASVISSDWETLDGSWSVVGGKARGAAYATLALKASVVAWRNKSYCQARMTRVTNIAECALYLRRNLDVDGYYVGLREGQYQYWLVSNNSFSNLENLGLGQSDGVEYLIHHYCADGDQRSWRNGVLRSTETDTVLDGQIGQPALWARITGEDSDYDDFVYCTDRFVMLTGLLTGWKAKVLGAADALIAEATESAGTATIDLGGKDIPIGGWPAIIITNGSDVEQDRWDSGSPGFAGVYPGDSYSN